ncbi:hypothetical protein QBC37DRAFT_178071 [Rhypophila decipiens]|uniref:Uncharacterized protein n=1 Tax=Rhypophila decipiens TaxID=261697 RepID=A0AAN6YJ92_9PEZI|nr:hypothetical protein QBC37DRAFT_178071 [Rhypophila decipiens]
MGRYNMMATRSEFYTFDEFREPGAARVFTPPKATSGHEGGDGGLINNFSRAVKAVTNGTLSVEEAQAIYVGCTLKEAFMSHAMVFAAEEARVGRKVVDWHDWWEKLEERMVRRRALLLNIPGTKGLNVPGTRSGRLRAKRKLP